MFMVVWNGTLEHDKEADGLSSYQGGSSAQACMDRSPVPATHVRRWGHSQPLQEAIVQRVRMLREAGWGYQKIASRLKVTEWQARGAARLARSRAGRRTETEQGSE